MTGLAFPPDANFNREASYEDGTPMSNGDDHIPIDPVLTGAIDPVLMAGSDNEDMKIEQRSLQIPELNLYQQHQQQLQLQLQLQHQLPQQFGETREIPQARQYSQGPQGDPFAPPPLPYHSFEALVAEQQRQQQHPPTKPKRKRRIRREEECGFCSGTDQRNKAGQPERMATCLECGRSGHPSCMELHNLGEAILSYPWRCIECKICELCQEKGDDAQILFCDRCDRGWHMYCFVPPITETPKGEWTCPGCPPIVPSQATPTPNGMMLDHYYPGQFEMPLVEGEAGSSSSVASTSALQQQQPEPGSRTRKGRPPGKVKGRTPKMKSAVAAPVGENDEDAMDVEDTVTNNGHSKAPVTPQSRAGASVKRARKASRRFEEYTEEEEEGEEEEEEAPALVTPIRSRRRKPKEVAKAASPAHHLPRVRLRLPSQLRGKGKGKEREEDAHEGSMFDDILGESDRDTFKTQITRVDTLLFERSRQIAEEKVKPVLPPPTTTTTGRHANSELFEFSTPGPSRPLRSATLHQISTNLPGTPSTTTAALSSASPVPSTPGGGPFRSAFSANLAAAADPNVLRIHTIRFGEYDIKTWYDAPFPEEYATIPDGRLWICEFCLKYMKSRFGALRHRIKCKARHPPGDEIYRDGAVSIFEVDGRRNKIYCQNLCLLSKMFLDHKSLFYDVEPFLFYVITELDDVGHRFVGYFSKEKRSPKDYNVSCIMTLPVRQRKGWGNLLIDFSYLLSKKEERTGSPEKPLSSLGAIGYRKYWTLALMRYLQHAPDQVRLEDISRATSMTLEDVCQTLTEQNMLYVREPSPPLVRPSPGQAIKIPKGRKNGVARRQLQRLQTQKQHPHLQVLQRGDSVGSVAASDSSKGPFVPPTRYEVRFDKDKAEGYVKDWEAKGYLKLKPEKLQWTPYLLSRMAPAPAGKQLQLLEEVLVVSASVSGSLASPSGEASSSVALDLFSPPPEENDEDDVLPEVRMGTRSRTQSPKKLPSKVQSKNKRRKSSPPISDEEEEEGEDSRRTRGRRSSENGLVSPTTRRVLPTRVKDESEERPLRSINTTPTKEAGAVRKRRRVASPEEEDEEEEAVANGVHVEGPPESPEVGPSETSEARSEPEQPPPAPAPVNGHTYFPDEEMHDEDADGEDEDAEGEVDPDY